MGVTSASVSLLFKVFLQTVQFSSVQSVPSVFRVSSRKFKKCPVVEPTVAALVVVVDDLL